MLFKKIFSIVILSTLLPLRDLQAQVSVTPMPSPEASAPKDDEEDTPRNFSYTSVPEDPTKTRIYKLDNGLTVYLSVNKDEPRIQTYIAVRAGSKNDPAETTGLAHYLEHMLFKGTDEIGTRDYKMEAMKLEEISELFERHRMASDPEEKMRLYAEIDRLSGQAAFYAIPNEYDKMVSAMGAKGTNAWTSFDQTVYTNDIPSTELESWASLESHRFQTLVLRLFHTELETVYEEFNISQDRDARKSSKALFAALFPDHPYGTQTTIGEGEHLKNPSMVNIHNYFNQYYVPTNMAICMAGDMDPDESIAILNRHFGQWQFREIAEWEVPGGEGPQGVQHTEVFGQEPENVLIGYRLPAFSAIDWAIARMVDGLLQNGSAGLIDLNLVQQQKVLGASSYLYVLADHSMHLFSARPREGQSLEEAEALLMAELEKLRRGDYPDWMLQAVINNEMLKLTRRMEGNRGRAGAFVEAFTLGMSWEEYLNQFNFLKRVRKTMVTDFVNKHYGADYAVVYKRQGEDTEVYKVEKPNITPITANRNDVSFYASNFLKRKVDREKPEFVDYKKAISDSRLSSKVPFSAVKNNTNELFQLTYILDMGQDHDPLLALATEYFPYLGTDTSSASGIAQAFFRLGLEYSASASRDRISISLSGLDENMEEGVKLLEYMIAHLKPDQQALNDLVDGIIKERENAKTQKNVILMQAMYNYARFGPTNPFSKRIPESELRALQADQLVDKLKDVFSYEHRIFYYGPRNTNAVISLLDQYHKAPAKRTDLPEAFKFKEQATDQGIVYFVHFDMVQAQILMMSKGPELNPKLMPMLELFNDYFGSGLSSIVFQEIRESRALAYSAYANYGVPQNVGESHYLRAFVGTQVDKMPEAITAMQNLLQDMPEATQQFESSRESVLKRIESDRITKASIFWSRENNLRRNIKYDIRKDVYSEVSKTNFTGLNSFFKKEIAGKPFNYLVMADRSKVDMSSLHSLGTVRELTLEEIFGY